MTQDEIADSHVRMKYFQGFDYLRIVLCIFIVGWHIKILGWADTFINPASSVVLPTIADIIYADLFLVAVPLFFLISTFLYIANRKNKTGYFRKRLFYLILVYIFWFIIFSFVFSDGLKYTYIFSPIYIMTGAGSVGYFLFSLIILVVITESMYVLQNILDARQFLSLTALSLFISCSLLIIRVPLSHAAGTLGVYFLGFWSPVNFLAYPFIAFLLMTAYDEKWTTRLRWKHYFGMASLIVILIAAEWWLLPDKINPVDGMSIAPYARLSVVVSSILVFLLFVQIQRETPPIIKVFSELTMGIFLLHSIIIFKLPEISSF